MTAAIGKTPGAQIMGFKRDDRTGQMRADVKAAGVDVGQFVDSMNEATEATLEDPRSDRDSKLLKKEGMALLQLSTITVEETLSNLLVASKIDSYRGVFGIPASTY